jgi:hypothetical protein
MTVSAAGLLDGFTFFRGAASFPPARLGLAFAATVRFAGFPRADLEVLCALPRGADFPLRAAARFLL